MSEAYQEYKNLKAHVGHKLVVEEDTIDPEQVCVIINCETCHETLQKVTKPQATLRIIHDEDAGDPRKEYDNVGVMVCWHNRYCLGDKKNMCREYEDPREWFKENIDEEAGDVVLPLYLYDHSGITMRCAPFSCPWDSGQVGFIYAKADTIQKEWGDPKDPKVRERAAEYLKGEVRTYDYYLTGSVWGFVYEGPDGEDDSCWGFYGEDLENTGIEDSIPREALPLLKEAWEHRFDNNKQ